MSGWTCITVEPKDTSGRDDVSDAQAEKIISIAEDIYYGAKNADEKLDELQNIITEAQDFIEPVDTEQEVREWLDEWSKDFFKNSDAMVTWKDTPTVQYPARGEDCREAVDEILHSCEYANRVLVVTANDTSDSGRGWLCELQQGEVVLVDQFEGYEGARGYDVIGYFDEEYDICGCVDP